MIKDVIYYEVMWGFLFNCLEVGILNIVGVIGMGVVVDWFSVFDVNVLYEYE